MRDRIQTCAQGLAVSRWTLEGTHVSMYNVIAHCNLDMVYDVSHPSLQSGRIPKATIINPPTLTVALCDVATTHQTRQDQR